MFFQKASKYFVMLGLILVLLGTDRIVVLAQRKAKTKPAVPIRKTVEKPQGPEAELRDYARKYIDLYFTKCGGDSLYSYAFDIFNQRNLLEIRGLLIRASPMEVSKAESLNGLEVRGGLAIEAEAYRTYDFTSNTWGEWRDGRLDLDTPTVYQIPHRIYWVMEKRTGVWSHTLEISLLTNTKVKVKCDSITAPLPVWQQSP